MNGKTKSSIYIHSTDDRIVPYKLNSDYLTKAFSHTDLDTITLQKGNHFLPWNNHQLIREKLLELGNTQ
jgi:pimeloyl-ACP methyl ester carboxylesterase